MPINRILPVVHRLTGTAIPLLHWMGYSSLHLVSSAHIRNWTVLISEEPVVRAIPKRWFDISGSKIMDVWEAAMRAVMGVIVFHPGIPQVRPHLCPFLKQIPNLVPCVCRSNCDGDCGPCTTGTNSTTSSSICTGKTSS